jgi:hypothetical protein
MGKLGAMTIDRRLAAAAWLPHRLKEIDYFEVFPADTRMLYDKGNQMFR